MDSLKNRTARSPSLSNIYESPKDIFSSFDKGSIVPSPSDRSSIISNKENLEIEDTNVTSVKKRILIDYPIAKDLVTLSPKLNTSATNPSSRSKLAPSTSTVTGYVMVNNVPANMDNLFKTPRVEELYPAGMYIFYLFFYGRGKYDQ